jgi:hypothetical protein
MNVLSFERKKIDFWIRSIQPVVITGFHWLASIFFFLMLVIPATYQKERGIILVILLGGSLIYLLLAGWKIYKPVLLWNLVIVTASLWFMLIGLFNNAPGALRVGTVYVLWPILYIFFIGLHSQPKQIAVYFKIIVTGSIVVSLMGIMLVLDGLLNLNLGLLNLLKNQGGAFGLHGKNIEYRLNNMTTAIYAFPFLTALVLLPRKNFPLEKIWKLIIWLALGLTFVTALISGRKAFWLIVALSPLVAMFFIWITAVHRHFYKILIIGGIVGAIFVFFVITTLDIDLLMIWEKFKEGFEFSNVQNVSASARKDQFFALINEWQQTPFFGAGHGASAPGSIRDADRTWAYELTYVALLFHVGIFGFMIYSASIFWVFIKGIKIMTRTSSSVGFFIPALSALLCFLVANITNPYLEKFDYLWTIFLPIALINIFANQRN